MKKKQKTRSDYVDQLDKIFSVFIRKRDADEDGYVTCPLCSKRMYWTDSQCMHFITRGNYKYRRDENNCYAGCYRCNVALHGNYIVYTLFMINKFGRDKVEEMKYDKQIHKIDTWRIKEMIEEYKLKVADMGKSFING